MVKYWIIRLVTYRHVQIEPSNESTAQTFNNLNIYITFFFEIDIILITYCHTAHKSKFKI